MASKEYKRIQAAWGDVQDTRGNHYVPDMTTSMSLSTLNANRAKMAEAVRFWNEDPCAPNPPATASSDRMCNIKNDSDIVSTLKGIRGFVAGKLKAYDDRIAALTPTPVINQPSPTPVTVPAEVIGAGTTDTVTTDTGTEVDPPPPVTETDTDQAADTPVPLAAGSNKKMLIVGGIAALIVLVAIVVVIKRK